MYELYLQVLLNGLIAGCLYGLVSFGLSLVFNVSKFINLAHGILVVIASYFLFFFIGQLGLDLFLSSVITIIFSGILGVILYLFLYEPLIKRKTHFVVMLIVSFAVLLFFQNLLTLIFGSATKVYDIDVSSYSFFNIVINTVQIWILIIAISIFISLWFFLKKTFLGKSIRAVSDNLELAKVLGINTRKITIYSFFIASCVGGLAGILIGFEQNLTPYMGIAIIVKAFAGTIIGGVTSIFGSILGAVSIGFIENFGILYLPTQFKDAILYIILLLFLLFRPQGILGVKERDQ